MALNDIIFVKGQGGLGRPLTGEDHISGLLFYTANGNLPSGWSTTSRVKALYSVADAEKAGIKDDYSDATAATATYLISTKGNTGDTIQWKYTDAAGNVLDLGTYTVASGENSIALQGAAWAAIINAGTINHGCSASFDTATLTVTLPKSQGVYPNSGTPNAITLTGAFAGTLTQNVVAGVASKQAVWHYHISEFFRLQPKGVLYVGFFAVPGSYTFSDIQTIQVFANGKIRQIGVYVDGATFNTAHLTTIQGVCDTLAGLHMPLSVIYAANMVSVTDLSTLTDLNSLSNGNVSPVISQDGASLGAFLYITVGKSITTLGALLGAVALAKVREDIAWVSKFNISNGIECDTIAFANGTKLKDVSQSLLNQLDDYRYIFLIKYVGIAGSFFNDSHTAISSSSDYAYIENNRTIDKAIRGVYKTLLPELNGPLQLNADGTLTDGTVAYLESQAAISLDEMVRNTELSAYSVTIDPSQNVLSTGEVVVAVQLLPIGVARQITVNIGFTTSIQ